MARAKKRDDGRYQKQFTFNGKRYTVYAKTEEELVDLKREKIHDLEEALRDRTDPTLAAYYEEFTERRRKYVRGQTIYIQTYHFRKCAELPLDEAGTTLGKMRMSEIRPRDIKILQAELMKMDLSATTINDRLSHLSHVFNEAVKDETITRNPCVVVKRAKDEDRETAADTIHRALTEEETKAFFEEARESCYYPLFCLLIQTGMRIGEAGALVETDVDKKRGVLHVRRTMTRTETGAAIVGDSTKTEKGVRDIPLNAAILKAVRDQKELNMLLHGGGPLPALFVSFDGKHINKSSVNTEIRRICKRAGIEKFTCHALRATFATRFIEQQPENYKILSTLLGHSNISITLNLYTHVMDTRKVEAMNKISIAL